MILSRQPQQTTLGVVCHRAARLHWHPLAKLVDAGESCDPGNKADGRASLIPLLHSQVFGLANLGEHRGPPNATLLATDGAGGMSGPHVIFDPPLQKGPDTPGFPVITYHSVALISE